MTTDPTTAREAQRHPLMLSPADIVARLPASDVERELSFARAAVTPGWPETIEWLEALERRAAEQSP